jgi:hypothetical protein
MAKALLMESALALASVLVSVHLSPQDLAPLLVMGLALELVLALAAA